MPKIQNPPRNRQARESDRNRQSDAPSPIQRLRPHSQQEDREKRKRNFRKDQPTFTGDLKRFAPKIPYLV